jgi:hypothetical protein
LKTLHFISQSFVSYQSGVRLYVIIFV